LYWHLNKLDLTCFEVENGEPCKALNQVHVMSIGCSPCKDQTLGVWVILVKKQVSFISCFVQVFCMVCVGVV
jgi:hypothetical protein